MLDAAVVLEVQRPAIRGRDLKVAIADRTQRIRFTEVGTMPGIGTLTAHDIAGVSEQLAMVWKTRESQADPRNRPRGNRAGPLDPSRGTLRDGRLPRHRTGNGPRIGVPV